MFKYFFRFVVTLSIIVHSTQALTPDERQFIEKYKLPEVAEKILNSQFSESTLKESYKLGDFGEFILKTGLNRLVGAQYLKNFIEEAGIKHIKVADKYLYHIPNKHETLSDKNYKVAAKKIIPLESKKRQPLSLEAIEELAEIIRLTSYTDLFQNIIMSGIDELTIIDTEMASFNSRYINDALRLIPFELSAQAQSYLSNVFKSSPLPNRFKNFKNYPAIKEQFFNDKDIYSLSPELQQYVDLHAQRKENVYDALLYAIIDNNTQVVNQLISSGVSLDEVGQYNDYTVLPLATAIRSLNLSMANNLISHGASIDKLNFADKLLLDHLNGKKVSFKNVRVNNEPILSYYVSGYSAFKNVIPRLLSLDANVNDIVNGNSPLYKAVSFGDPTLVKIFLSVGADVKLPVPTGKGNLLQVAVEFEQPSVIPELLATNKFSYDEILQAFEKANAQYRDTYYPEKVLEIIRIFGKKLQEFMVPSL